jgi:RND family efflux transporter MFP subunit
VSNTKFPAVADSFFSRILTGRHFLTRRRKLMLFAGAVMPSVAALLLFQMPVVKSYLHSAPTASTTSNTAPAGQASSSPARPLLVSTLPLAQAGPPFLKQQYTGIIAARRTTQLAAKTLGRVEQLTVELGDRVETGQLLVRLDSQQLLAQREVVAANLSAAQALLAELKHGPRIQELDQSQARLKELQSLMEMQQAQLSRTEQLNGSSAISKQEMDESRFQTDAVRAQLRAAEHADALLQAGTRAERIDAQQATVAGLAAQIKNIDIQLEEKQIVAPYAGHIQARFVDEGAIVAAGQPLLEIAETDQLEVHVGLPSELADSLNHGGGAQTLLTTVGSRRLSSRVDRISPTIQSTTRTREVVLTVEPGEYYPPAIGSAVNVEYQIPVEAQGFWIPTAALTAGARGLWGVFVAVANSHTGSDDPNSATHTIARRQVELLRSQAEWSEVVGPIDAQELLVVEGVHRIVPGQAVRVTEPK